MGKPAPVILVLLFVILRIHCFGQELSGRSSAVIYQKELQAYQDSQVLYNGKIWHRKYYNVRGHEFLFTSLWVIGDITINNQVFNDKYLRYDIMDDELHIRRPDGVVLKLNKEMVSEFSLNFENVEYRFRNFGENRDNQLKGFARLLYDGETTLWLKSFKEIIPLGYNKVTDLYEMTEYLYVVKEDRSDHLRGRKGLLDFLNDRRSEVRKFIVRNRIIILPRQPESVIPVLMYYDSLSE